MYKHERRSTTLRILASKGFCSTGELARTLGISQATLYRDLRDMEEDGAIEKHYGGVILARKYASSVDFLVRETRNVTEKEKIAEKAIDLIKDGDSFFLDTSTTCQVLVRTLLERKDKKHLTAITNSCRLILMLEDDPDFTAICTGGTHMKKLDILVGSPAEEFISTISADKYFFSASGIMDHGTLDSEYSEVIIKRLILSRVKQRILLADHTKFDHISTFVAVAIPEIDMLITDSLTPKEKLAVFVKNNVRVIQTD
jgi:DeoR/GlpR family transcriptional regulator of sugar metabolism